MRRRRGVARCDGSFVGRTRRGSMVLAGCMVRSVADAVIESVIETMIDAVIDAMVRGMQVAVSGCRAGHGRAHCSAQRKHEHQQQQHQEA